jgi:thiamine monophosphate synthase
MHVTLPDPLLLLVTDRRQARRPLAEVIAARCAGVAVMGGVMRAADPGQEVRALVAILNGYPRAR